MSHSNLGVFSDAQSLGASAASTANIDMALVTQRVGVGKPVYLCIRIATADVATATSIAFQLENDGDSAFGSAVAFPLRAAIGYASLTLGTWVYRGTIPYEVTERYCRLYYTTGGSSATAGAVDAWLQSDPPPSDLSSSQVFESPVGNP